MWHFVPACVLVVGFLTSSAWGILLAWDYVQGTDPAVGFHLTRALPCTDPPLQLGGLLPLSPTTFTDTALPAGQTACYQVRAVNSAGVESGPSNLLMAQAPSTNTPPTAVPDSSTASSGAPLTIQVLTNDTD